MSAVERLVRTFISETELRPGDLLRHMQDLAGADADRRHGGRADLLAHDCVWVLVKNRLSVGRWPAAGESLALTTWPLQGRRGLYPRMFELRDAAGAVLVRAESVWAVIDVESRSMVTLESRGVEMEGVEEGDFRLPPRLRVPEGGESFTLAPRPEQIDANGHMNNAAYLDAAEELLPPCFAGRGLRAVAVDYEHELLAGRSARVRVVPEQDACFFEGSLDDRCCFRLKMEYR